MRGELRSPRLTVRNCRIEITLRGRYRTAGNSGKSTMGNKDSSGKTGRLWSVDESSSRAPE